MVVADPDQPDLPRPATPKSLSCRRYFQHMRRGDGMIDLPDEFIYPVVEQCVAVLAAFSFGDFYPAIGLLLSWLASHERAQRV